MSNSTLSSGLIHRDARFAAVEVVSARRSAVEIPAKRTCRTHERGRRGRGRPCYRWAASTVPAWCWIVSDVSLDTLLPTWQFRERHRRTTSSPASALLAAAEQVTWAEIPVMRVLMRLRSVGRLPLVAHHRVLDDMAALGFTVVGRTSDELVLAALGRPWAPGRTRAPRLAEQADPAGFFVHFAAPGWAKMIANFKVRGGELTTETRVMLTDERSRRAFGRYWLLIRPFSGLIRRRWLAAIVRRAGHA